MYATQSASVHSAAALGDIRQLRTMVEKCDPSMESPINQTLDDGTTPLHLAAGNGHTGMEKTFLQYLEDKY